jgi:hypothetical protein
MEKAKNNQVRHELQGSIAKDDAYGRLIYSKKSLYYYLIVQHATYKVRRNSR